MKVNVYDIIDIYEKEVSINTKNKNRIYNFEKHKMENIYDIKNIIENSNNKVIKYNIFFVNSPKYRIVMSLNIKDKVINHYVTRHILINKLDKYLDIRNCATRKGMGHDYAIGLVKKYIEINKKYDNLYVLKLDISKYFYSISHDKLKELLKDKLDDDEYNIVSNIIDSTNSDYVNERINGIKNYLIDVDIKRREEIERLPLYEKGYGLPIGNMTSQFLSIFYLYGLDHFIVNDLRLKYMVKYMDDYVIFSNDRKNLEKCYFIIRDKLWNEYKLKLNDNKSMIINVRDGFEYLGYIFSVKDKKTFIKIKSSNKKRRDKNIKYIYYLYSNGYISYSRYFCSINNYMNSYKYCKK